MRDSDAPLASILVRVLDRMDSPPSSHAPPPAVRLAWRLAVGPYLAEHSCPVSLVDGVLEVAVDAGMLKRELNRLRPQLEPRLTALLRQPIETLRFVVRKKVFAQRKASPPRPDNGGGDPERTVAPDGVADTLLEAAETAPEGLRPIILRLVGKHAARKQSQEGHTSER